MPSSKKWLRSVSIFFVLAMFISAESLAVESDPVKAVKEQLRRLQEQKRALVAEKNQLLQEKNDIANKLKTAEGEVVKKKAIENVLSETQRRLRIAADTADKLKSELAELKSQMSAKDSEVAKLNSQFETEKVTSARLEKELGGCSAKNEAMYKQGRVLLQTFGRGGACDVVIGEPLLGLGGVARENALETARDGLDTQRFLEAPQN